MSKILSNREGRRILFVCTGNICRSPMAEYLFNHLLGDSSGWKAESAGTHTIDGEPASPPAVEFLRNKGIDLSPHRSRRITNEIAQACDLIVTMTDVQAEEIKGRFPELQERVFTLKSFAPGSSGGNIQDPIGSSIAVYRRVCEDIEKALSDLIPHLNRG